MRVIFLFFKVIKDDFLQIEGNLVILQMKDRDEPSDRAFGLKLNIK